jgi:hypothetical protein
VFATKLSVERSVVVTMLVPRWMQTFEKASSEVKRCLTDLSVQRGEIRYVRSLVISAPSETNTTFLRVIAFGEHSTDIDPSKMAGGDAAVFEPIWMKLIKQQSLKCSATGTDYAAAAKPSLCVFDVST